MKSVTLRSKAFCIMRTFQNMLKTCLRCWKGIIILQKTLWIWLWILIVFEQIIGIIFVLNKIDDAMDDSIWQYKLQPMVTSVFDGNVFLVRGALSIIWLEIYIPLYLQTYWIKGTMNKGSNMKEDLKRLLKNEIGASKTLSQWLLNGNVIHLILKTKIPVHCKQVQIN